MKRFVFILSLGWAAGMFNVNQAAAQHVSVHVNIDHQPAWGPTGYDYVAFYYFPELNIYFDVNNARFYYLSGRKWMYSYYLPMAFRRYDLYRMYKVVLNDYPKPWIHNRLHIHNYKHFRHNYSQVCISHSKEHRYNKARNNTRAWVEPRRSRSSYGNHNGRHPDERSYAAPAQRGKSNKAEAKKDSDNKRRNHNDASPNKRSGRSDNKAIEETRSSRNDNKSSTRSNARNNSRNVNSGK
ncbi:MAG: hypothetical protein LBD27_01030 [Tannerella sp.]|jgi:hypothetical protein|nr:hypothetical protein [Tannerella sp.]